MTVVDDKFFQARITKRVDFAPDLWMFRIQSGGPFKFVPGQYATLGVEEGGKRIERPYSIVSSPHEAKSNSSSSWCLTERSRRGFTSCNPGTNC